MVTNSDVVVTVCIILEDNMSHICLLLIEIRVFNHNKFLWLCAIIIIGF